MSIPFRGNFNALNIDDWDREMLTSGFQAVESVPDGWAVLGRADVPGRRDCLYCGVQVERRPNCNICDGTGTVERSFMFDAEEHPDPVVSETIKQINKAVNDRYGGHSGSSYGFTMRMLEFIAKRGWDTYAKDVIRRCGAKPVPASAPAAQAPLSVAAVLDRAAQMDRFINTLPSNTNLTQFANAIQNDPGMRAQIPDIDEQVAGLHRYAQAVEDAQKNPESWKKSNGFPYPCPCHKAQGKEGWCGVAGFGVPACEH